MFKQHSTKHSSCKHSNLPEALIHITVGIHCYAPEEMGCTSLDYNSLNKSLMSLHGSVL